MKDQKMMLYVIISDTLKYLQASSSRVGISVSNNSDVLYAIYESECMEERYLPAEVKNAGDVIVSGLTFRKKNDGSTFQMQ